METNLFNKVVDQVPDDPRISFEMASYGETLLSKDWQKMIQYLISNKKKLCTVFVTNGVILNESICQFFLNNPVKIIQVSIDAATPEGYKWLTGNNAFDKAVKNLRYLCDLRKKRKLHYPEIQTHIIACKEFEKDNALFINTWKDLVDRAGVRPLGNWGGLIDENGITPLWSPPLKRYPCFWPFFATKVMPDGEVHKCHIHFLSGKPGIGFIQNSSIREIWKSKELKTVRDKQLDGAYSEEPMCEKCNIWAFVPNFWKKGEYREVNFTGKRYPNLPPQYPE